MTKRTVPTPTGPLAGLAIRVRDNARLLHSLRTDARQIQELKEREQRLRGLADQSTSLANSARLLRDAGRPPTIPSAIALALHDVADYRQRGQVRVTRIEEALRQAEASLLATWRAPFAAIESARALAVLLERFPQLKTARLRIQEGADRLAASLASLPTTPLHVQTTARLLTALNAEVSRLQDEGLDADVQAFLRQSASGVTLEALLEMPEVLKFLRENRILSSFTVTLRTPGQVPR